MSVAGDSKLDKHAARKQKPLGSGYDAPFRGYINLNLSVEQKTAYDAWSESAALWDALSFQVSDGVNLSVKVDTKGSGYLASATQRRENSENAGLVVTARGRDPVQAFGRCLFCLTILSQGERWEDIQPLADPDRW